MIDKVDLRNRSILHRVKNKNVIICYNDKNEILVVNSIYEVPEGYEIKRKPFSKASREKMSQSAKRRCARGLPETFFRERDGEKNPMYGKKQSEETKKKISESMSKHSRVKGKHAYYNPKTLECKFFKTDEVPEGWIKGMKPRENSNNGCKEEHNKD